MRLRGEPLSTCRNKDCVEDLVTAWRHSWQAGYRAAVQERHEADVDAHRRLIQSLNLTPPPRTPP